MGKWNFCLYIFKMGIAVIIYHLSALNQFAGANSLWGPRILHVVMGRGDGMFVELCFFWPRSFEFWGGESMHHGLNVP